MKHISIFTLLLTMMLYKVCLPQVAISQIRVGNKFPKKIHLGGFKDVTKKNTDCNCKLYLINYGKPVSDYGTILKFVEISYSEDRTVFAIKKAEVRATMLDVYIVYIGSLSYFIRAERVIKDWKLIDVRDTGKGGEVDGIYYYKYFITSENTFNTYGILGGNLIEERYLKNSKYKSVFKN